MASVSQLGLFPFCIPEENPDGTPFQEWDGQTEDSVPLDSNGNPTVFGGGTYYPVGFSLSEIFLMFRVRLWQVSITQSFRIEYQSNEQTIEFGADFYINGFFGPNKSSNIFNEQFAEFVSYSETYNETLRACSPYYSHFLSVGSEGSGTLNEQIMDGYGEDLNFSMGYSGLGSFGGLFTGVAYIGLPLSFEEFFYPKIIKVGNMYYPIFIYTIGDYFPLEFVFSTLKNNSILRNNVAAFSCNFNGRSLPLFFNDVSQSLPDGQITTNLGSINISPYRYWPFDPNDGDGPIYDGVTGEQLRGFPS